MNITQMLTGYAFGTIKPKIIDFRKEEQRAAEERKRAESLKMANNTRQEELKQRRAQIPDLLKQGLKQRQIAQMFGVSENTICKDVGKLVELGLVKRREERAIPDSKTNKNSKVLQDRIAEACSGRPKTMAELADIIGFHRASILYHVKRMIKNKQLTKIAGHPYRLKSRK